MAKYTQGICADGAAIVKDGKRMTIEEILGELNSQASTTIAGSMSEETYFQVGVHLVESGEGYYNMNPADMKQEVDQILNIIAESGKPSSAAAVPLASKHTGMRVSAPGILNRVGGRLKPGAQEMLRHLQEVSERYYSGDLKAVDEFFQLYCLDDTRPETTEGV
ncbi:hypothetical protein [Hahella ganghwensis]|uniref:hypothetical protein n=1 Tax=Hahella ganghwensis TaxID=286420 RepID=UPI0003653A4B|nr:hypothetical protein [Hahella ganghwensis]